MKKNNEVLKFLKYLTKLEIIEAVGIARLLGVELVVRNDNESTESQPSASITEKDYDTILSEMVDAFVSTTKNKRRFILSIMKESVKNA